jgi:flavodoxin
MRWKVGCWGRPGSNSAKIAAHIAQRIGGELVDFHSRHDAPIPAHLVIVTPNHGDAEVQEDVEKFLVARGREVAQWVVLEIGNYYGFDDWSYGARERIALYMKKQGKPEEALPGGGIDTLPQIDWATLDRWCEMVLQEEAADVV